MAEILTFSLCLNRLMQKHDLTPHQLSSACGCSRSEIKQLLSHEGTPSKRNLLFEKLKSSSVFKPDELAELEHSLEISRIGVDAYRFQTAITDILTGGQRNGNHLLIAENGSSLGDRLSVFKAADELEIVCLNCCFSSVIDALLPLFENKERSVAMQHFISLEPNQSRSASLVTTILPLLSDQRYHPLGISAPKSGEIEPLSGNLLAVRGKNGENSVESFMIILDDAHFCEMPPVQAFSMMEFVSQMFRTLHPTPIPLKETANAKQDFTDLCMSFLSHELNRATYSIMYGLSFSQIPLETALAAIQENDYFSKEQLRDVLQRTVTIHEQRFQNLYSKRKPTCMIMTKSGCEEFLGTGLTLDHFVGFRAFTPEERKSIFRTMLDNAKVHPFFVPLLLRDDSIHFHFNIECYDKLGVLIDAKDTNYDLSSGYQPIFLKYPDFTRQFQAFYLDTLTTKHCYSREESLEILEKMYNRFLSSFSLED